MMNHTFDENAAKGVDVTFQYIIDGKQGGNWAVYIKDGTLKIKTEVAENATCTMKANDVDFIALRTGELNPMVAFSQGKLRIEGDVMKSQLIEQIFSKEPEA